LFTAIEWLLPLTAIIFSLTIGSTYWFETEYAKSYVKFCLGEKNYRRVVANTPSKNKAPKLVVFNWDGADEEPRLLVYDEDDNLSDINSDHKKLFEVWPPIAPGVVLSPNRRIPIYQIKSKRIKDHFYMVFVDYAARPLGYIQQ
jgi:hypothetical protein